MAVVEPSVLATAVMAKLYDVLTNGDNVVSPSDDNFFSWNPAGTPMEPADVDFLTQGLTESQRYFSAVWIVAREAVEDDVIDGHRIRKGTTAIIPIHHIHHDARWWPNPGDFDPTGSCRAPGRSGRARHTCVRRRTAHLHRAELCFDGDGADGVNHESAVHL